MPDESKITNSQIGVLGDNAHVEGGIHYTTYQHIPPQPVDLATLAAAQRQLATLPLDGVPPPPAPLPPCSRMPFRANPLFVGRQIDLQTLAQVLKGEHSTAAIGQTAAATGLGGIGKTQLASEFAHCYGRYFAGGVFWLSFAPTHPGFHLGVLVWLGLEKSLLSRTGRTC